MDESPSPCYTIEAVRALLAGRVQYVCPSQLRRVLKSRQSYEFACNGIEIGEDHQYVKDGPTVRAQYRAIQHPSGSTAIISSQTRLRVAAHFLAWASPLMRKCFPPVHYSGLATHLLYHTERAQRHQAFLQ